MNHISIEASRALASYLGIPQEDDPLAWRQSLSQQLEQMLDRQMELIALLDLMDGDSDLEPWLEGDELEGDELDGPLGESDGYPDDEDTHDAEWTNEDGGNVTDEPHDALDEGNDEASLDGLIADCGIGFMGYEAKKAIDIEVRTMLAKVNRKPVQPTPQQITGPDGRIWTMVW